eukprot:8415592-Alexandrium_andersonii.AAC.1
MLGTRLAGRFEVFPPLWMAAILYDLRDGRLCHFRLNASPLRHLRGISSIGSSSCPDALLSLKIRVAP